MTAMNETDRFEWVESIDAARGCYPLMRQLRPHLLEEAEFLERWQRQSAAGYRILVVQRAGRPVALAGCRLQENLIHGRFLYVDDLVTDEALRGSGLGERLLTRLKEEARAQGCAKLVLDTGLDNALGHRFYYRQGLLGVALRFAMALR